VGTLVEDLAKYSNEVYTKRDIKAGLMLIAEIGGGITLAAAALGLLTVVFPAAGVPISATAVAHILRSGAFSYAQLDTEQRRRVRAAVSFLRKMFTGGSPLSLDQLSDLIDRGTDAADIPRELPLEQLESAEAIRRLEIPEYRERWLPWTNNQYPDLASDDQLRSVLDELRRGRDPFLSRASIYRAFREGPQ
jgi:hypothetical protein